MTNPQAPTDRIEPWVWRIALVVILGSMMSILDTTMVIVALQTLHQRLHSPLNEIQWVVTGYLLALAAVIPVSGWAAQRFGAKNVYLLSLVLFTVGSALCGLATSTPEIVGFRVLQGVGGGMLLPVGQLILAHAAGPKRMGRVMAVLGVPMMLGPVIGPTIGGLIIDGASWRWLFYVNVPVGLLSLVLAVRMLPAREASRTIRKLDVPGLLLMATGLPLLVYGLSEIGESGGFSSAKVYVPIAGAAVLLAIFVWHALRIPKPLLQLRLFKNRVYASASLAILCLGAVMYCMMVLLPLYFQNVRHESVLDTGLLLAPQGIAGALVAPLAGRLADRIGGGPLVLGGTILTTLIGVPFGLVGAHTSMVWLGVLQVVRGVGMSFGMMPVMIVALAALERHELPDATPQFNALLRTGGSIGTAAIAVILERALAGAGHHPTVAAFAGAYGTAFWGTTAMVAVAIVPCVFMWRSERTARRARAASPSAASVAAPSEALTEAVA